MGDLVQISTTWRTDPALLTFCIYFHLAYHVLCHHEFLRQRCIRPITFIQTSILLVHKSSLCFRCKDHLARYIRKLHEPPKRQMFHFSSTQRLCLKLADG